MGADYTRILNDLKKKIYKGIYFLYGDEPYYIDLITNYISENTLTESEKSFNQLVVYGEDSDITDIVNTARRFPMMANLQVVIVKEAQYLKEIDKLKSYVEHPLSSTLLVICYKYKKLDKRTELYKLLNKSSNVELFFSEKLRDYKVPAWIDAYLAEHNIEADRNVSMILSEFLGANLDKIVNELDKLLITIPKGSKRITATDIEEKIGISKEFNNFELQVAIGKKDIAKVGRIINHFEHNQKDNPFVVTIATLFAFFRKLLIYHFLADKSKNSVASALGINPFFVSDYSMAARIYTPRHTVIAIALLREFDLKSKGVGNITSGDGELLKELVFKIMNQA
jgi:DNA polymerase-3 subunit delta